MKKILLIVLALCTVCVFSFAITSCDSNGDDGNSTVSTVGGTTGTTQGTTGSTDGSTAGTAGNSGNSTTDTSNNGTTDTTQNGEPGDTQPETVNYLIKLVDGTGKAFEEVVDIEVFKDGVSVGESAVRRGGARFTLEKGEYTFILKNFDGDFYYNEAACVIGAEEEEITVTVYRYAENNKKQEIWVPNEKTGEHLKYNALEVFEGSVYVTIDRPEGTYFVFTPTRGGIYKISYESTRSISFGYYGAPHNVLTSCPLEIIDKSFTTEVKDDGVNTGSGGTTQIVIGMSSKVVKGCILKIERIGNATVELPWIDISVDKNETKADNHINSEFIDFDVKDQSLSVVYNENDGYYHLNSVDGPVIYVRISNAVIKSQSETETVYLYLPSFITMCDTDRLGKVFYDEQGNIVLKESYNEMFKEYSVLAGANGFYPLNKQLADAIKNIGEHKGWFDFDSELHIFGEEKNLVVKENAWLFACVYENQYAKGTESTPIVLAPDSIDSAKTQSVLVAGSGYVAIKSRAAATIKVANAQGIKLVLSDGTEVVADGETGVLTAEIGANVGFKIVNESGEETVVRFTLVESLG